MMWRACLLPGPFSRLLSPAAPLLQKWHLAALYYTLRLAMAPAIESLLLLDRLLFLRELPGVQAGVCVRVRGDCACARVY